MKFTPHYLCVFFLSIIQLLSLEAIHSQNNSFYKPPSFKSYSVEQGLSQSYVIDMIQDQQGFMWFTTMDGLNRFDGYHFKVYKHNSQDSTSIGFNRISAIYLNKQGDIWLGGNKGEISKYSNSTGSFKNYTLFENLNSEIYINCFYEDNDGILWVGTSEGLYTFNTKTNAFLPIKFNEESDSKASIVFSILPDQEGNLFLGTSLYNTGLFYLDLKTNKAYHFVSNLESIKFPFTFVINKLAFDENKNLLLGTPKGLYSIDSEAWIAHVKKDTNTKYIKANFEEFTNLVDDSIGHASEFLIDNNQDIWLGGFFGKGIRKFNSENNTLEVIKYQEEFTSLAISSLLKDRSGNLWIGTNGGGLYKEETSKDKIALISKENNTSFSIKNNSFRGILADSKNQLWLGGYAGLDLINLNDNSAEHIYFKGLNKNDPPRDLPIWFIYEDPYYEGDIYWIGTELSGLFKYNLNKKKVEDEFIKKDKINSVFPLSMLRDSENQLWVATHTGLEKYHEEENKFYEIEIPTAICSENDRYLHQVIESKIDPKYLWIGSSKCGLILFNKTTEEFHPIPIFENESEEPLELNVTILHESTSGNLIVGTKSGLFIIDNSPSVAIGSKTIPIKSFSTLNGLPNNSINGLIESSDNMIWVSSNFGISEINLKHSAITNYDQYDGLQGIEFNLNSYAKGIDQKIYFGGSKGVNIIDPNSIKKNNNIPAVIITDFKVLNKSFPLKDEQGHSVTPDKAKNIALNYTDNIISFEFAALEYTLPLKNKYAYKLEGFNEDWIYINNNREAYFTNLDPGNYTFKVKASNNDGLWNEAGYQVNVIISPPWWLTIWAKGIWIGLIVVVLYFINRLFTYRVKMKERVKMSEEQVFKLKELDQLKTNLFSNISHEFRTPLTLILNPLKSVLTKVSKTEVKDEINLVIRNANKLLQLINQILDISKLEDGKMKKVTEQGDVIRFIKVLMASFDSLAESIPVDFQKQYKVESIFTDYNSDHLEKIINNIVSNAFKFTPKGGKVKILFDLETKGTSSIFIIKLTDTGIGISNDELPKIFDRFYQADLSANKSYEGTGIGLALVKELIDFYDGTITVKSELDWGTEITIHLPFEDVYFVNDTSALDTLKPKSKPLLELQKKLPKEDVTTIENSEKNIILVVEDNQDLRNYICSHLKHTYEVLEAKNGLEGLELALNHIPDIIISDVMMPKMDGFELTKKLKEDQKTSHIPIILLTAMSSQENKLSGLKFGADEYLAKPFDDNELKIRVKNLIQIRTNLQAYFKNEEYALNHKNIPTKESKFLTDAKDIVLNNLDNAQFSIEYLSSEIGMSRVQFHRKIKALTNHSTTHFIRTIRLEQAKQLLIENNYNVTEIAYLVGFSSQSYFTKSFIKHFGKPPTTFYKN